MQIGLAPDLVSLIFKIVFMVEGNSVVFTPLCVCII